MMSRVHTDQAESEADLLSLFPDTWRELAGNLRKLPEEQPVHASASPNTPLSPEHPGGPPTGASQPPVDTQAFLECTELLGSFSCEVFLSLRPCDAGSFSPPTSSTGRDAASGSPAACSRGEPFGDKRGTLPHTASSAEAMPMADGASSSGSAPLLLPSSSAHEGSSEAPPQTVSLPSSTKEQSAFAQQPASRDLHEASDVALPRLTLTTGSPERAAAGEQPPQEAAVGAFSPRPPPSPVSLQQETADSEQEAQQDDAAARGSAAAETPPNPSSPNGSTQTPAENAFQGSNGSSLSAEASTTVPWATAFRLMSGNYRRRARRRTLLAPRCHDAYGQLASATASLFCGGSSGGGNSGGGRQQQGSGSRLRHCVCPFVRSLHADGGEYDNAADGADGAALPWGWGELSVFGAAAAERRANGAGEAAVSSSPRCVSSLAANVAWGEAEKSAASRAAAPHVGVERERNTRNNGGGFAAAAAPPPPSREGRSGVTLHHPCQDLLLRFLQLFRELRWGEAIRRRVKQQLARLQGCLLALLRLQEEVLATQRKLDRAADGCFPPDCKESVPVGVFLRAAAQWIAAQNAEDGKTPCSHSVEETPLNAPVETLLLPFLSHAELEQFLVPSESRRTASIEERHLMIAPLVAVLRVNFDTENVASSFPVTPLLVRCYGHMKTFLHLFVSGEEKLLKSCVCLNALSDLRNIKCVKRKGGVELCRQQHRQQFVVFASHLLNHGDFLRIKIKFEDFCSLSKAHFCWSMRWTVSAPSGLRDALSFSPLSPSSLCLLVLFLSWEAIRIALVAFHMLKTCEEATREFSASKDGGLLHATEGCSSFSSVSLSAASHPYRGELRGADAMPSSSAARADAVASSRASSLLLSVVSRATELCIAYDTKIEGGGREQPGRTEAAAEHIHRVIAAAEEARMHNWAIRNCDGLLMALVATAVKAAKRKELFSSAAHASFL
ncbi:hypothetical protein cyc_00609 [Cyclospora cayetanensis]|uniref:Uncharacterized protein n=1 Tax=Cyclospora cayetanensis TaxID=88456 RepID=A0A1D3CRP8_9EIME|nr:hypothetical protein cyc_00609 [Cyclospora cayetanensis]